MSSLFQSVRQLEASMTFHRARQTVLAGNVANLDTPGYKPMDIERVGVGESTGLAMRGTARGHIAPPPELGVTTSFDDAGALQGGDGNGVNLERELAKIDANRVRYDTASALVSRRLALLKYAAADGIG